MKLNGPNGYHEITFYFVFFASFIIFAKTIDNLDNISIPPQDKVYCIIY